MNEKVASKPISAYLMTNARCVDPRMSRLSQGYIDDKLLAEEISDFRRHLLRCLSCAINVKNAKTMTAAISDRALDDETLKSCLEPVQLEEPRCQGWREIAAAMMNYRP